MKCISCAHWNLRTSGQMARMGFAQCDKKRKGHYTSCNAEACAKFKEIENDKVQARVEWLDKKG